MLWALHLPDYPIPDQKTPEDYLKEMSMQGLASRLSTTRIHAFGGEFDSREAYQERLDFELDVINQMGFAGYF